jgi:hypothetical protein
MVRPGRWGIGGNMGSEKHVIIQDIADYLRAEDFPVLHLRVVRKIIGLFNYSEQTEKKVFEFIKELESIAGDELWQTDASQKCPCSHY